MWNVSELEVRDVVALAAATPQSRFMMLVCSFYRLLTIQPKKQAEEDETLLLCRAVLKEHFWRVVLRCQVHVLILYYHIFIWECEECAPGCKAWRSERHSVKKKKNTGLNTIPEALVRRPEEETMIDWNVESLSFRVKLFKWVICQKEEMLQRSRSASWIPVRQMKRSGLKNTTEKCNDRLGHGKTSELLRCVGEYFVKNDKWLIN